MIQAPVERTLDFNNWIGNWDGMFFKKSFYP